MSENGDILNDCHAEVMCRRGFIRYLYDHINASISTKDSIITFSADKSKFQCNKNISFHFFTTHSPCGDASIYSLNNEESNDEIPEKKLKLFHPTTVENDFIGNTLSGNSSTNVNFTGAKVISRDTNVVQDLMIQSSGEIRTKPGRGNPTLSMSCSDKLAKWNILGIEGSLIHNLLEKAIYLKSITFCDSKFCNVASVERAIWKRFASRELPTLPQSFESIKPIIQICEPTVKFMHEKNEQLEAAPSSIIWCKVGSHPHQVAICGKRQGITKKKANSRSARLLISKIELFRAYIDIMKNMNQTLHIYPDDTDLQKLEYCEGKQASTDYQNLWNDLKERYFLHWTSKPLELNKFNLD